MATTQQQQGLSYKQQLKFALAGVSSRDLQQTSVAAARAVLRALTLHHNSKHQLKAAVQDLVHGIDVVPKHAVKPRLQLAEYVVLECASHECLLQLLPILSQQANVVLAAHRQDAGCINSLAALLSSCVAKLLHGCQGSSYAAIHGSAQAGPQQVTAEYLCDALLFPVIKSTYRDPEQLRVSAGSVLLAGLFEVLKAHTDLAAVIEAVRRCLGLMLQLMAAGSVAERAPGVFVPVCRCVEVLGLSMDREATRRLLKLAMKAATSQGAWQVRRDACQALAVLAASLQFRPLPQDAPPDLLTTPAVELLVAQKVIVLEVLDVARFDRIAAVRAAAAAAWAEFRCLPDVAADGDAMPVGQLDKAPGSASKLKHGSNRPYKRAVGAGGLSPAGRQHLPPLRFVRPTLPPGTERDFGVLVFAPPYPPPQPPEPVSPEHSEADTSQAYGSDQSPVARQLFGEQRVGTPVDAASQTGEGDPAAQCPYLVESPLSAGMNPVRNSLEAAQLQQQLAAQLQQQQSGLPSLLAATGLAGSPVRLDISHHVHGRVEVAYSTSSSPGPAAAAASQPRSPTHTPSGAQGDLFSAIAASAVAELGHSVQTIHATFSEPSSWQQQPQQQQQQQAADEKLTHCSTSEVALEPSFGPACADTAIPAAAMVLPDPDLLNSFVWQPVAPDAANGLSSTAALGPQADGGPCESFALAEAPLPAASTDGQVAAAAEPPVRPPRQRWQLPPVSVSIGEGECSPSCQRTPTGTAPKSPSSLEVLRSVGERVQHLLETISRQTSNSSRQGSRSPTASQVGQTALGAGPILGAAPVAQVLFQGNSAGSSNVDSPMSASSPVGVRHDAAAPPAAPAAAAGVSAGDDQHPLVPADRMSLAVTQQQQLQQQHELQQPTVELPEELDDAQFQQQAFAGQMAAQLRQSQEPQQSQELQQSQQLQLQLQQSQELQQLQQLRHSQDLQQSQQLQQSQELHVRQSQELQQPQQQETHLQLMPDGLPGDAGAEAAASQEQLQAELEVAAVAGMAAAADTLQPCLADAVCGGAGGRGDGAAVSTSGTLPHGAIAAAQASPTADTGVADDVCCLTHALGLHSPGPGSPQNGGGSNSSHCEKEQQLGAAAEGLATAVMAHQVPLSEQRLLQPEPVQLQQQLGVDLVADAAPKPAVTPPAAPAAAEPAVHLPGAAVSCTAVESASLVQQPPDKQQPQQGEPLQQEGPPVAPVSSKKQQTQLQLQEAPNQQQLLQLLLAPDSPGQQSLSQQAQEQLGSPAQHSWQQPITQDMCSSHAGEASPGSITQPFSLSAAQDLLLATLEGPTQDGPNAVAPAAATVQPSSLADGAGLCCASMQPNHEAQGSDAAPAWQALDAVLGLGNAAAAPVASASGHAGPDSTAGLVTASLPTEVGGLSRVDQALEKLQSLRSTLRTISNSGTAPSSTAVSAQDSLANGRAVSAQLGAAEACGSALQQAPQLHSCTGAAQDTVCAAAAAGAVSTAAGADGMDPAPTGASALASAKDWILEISQRLQQVGGPEQADAAQGVQAGPGAPTIQAAGDTTVQQQVASDHSAAMEPSTQLAASTDSPSSTAQQVGLDLAEPASPHARGTPDAVQATGLQAAASEPQQEAAQVPGALANGRPAQLRAVEPSSAGWSTLTDSGASSMRSSRQYGSLLLGCCGSSPHPSTAAAAGEEALAATQAAEECTEGISSASDKQLCPTAAQPGAMGEQPQQQQQVVEAATAGTALVVVPPEEAAAVMAESRQRLQQLLAAPDDTMLLMSFAAKLERLGRRFAAHVEEREGMPGSRSMGLPASDDASPLDTPRSYIAGLASPNSAASPPCWRVTHNSLYNTSAASTPQKPVIGGVASLGG